MKRALLIGSVLFVLAAGCVLVWQYRPIRNTFYTDAESIRTPLSAATPRDILWQPPVELPSEINSDADDYEPRMSADGLTLYFVRGKAGKNADIFVSTRSVQGWTEPQPVDEVNSNADDLGPEPAADGGSLYFYSNRDGSAGGYDLWVARRGDRLWQTPVNLGPAVNTEYNDYGPAISPDGRTLCFASNRPDAGDARQPDPNAWTATLREDLFHRTYDLYAASITDAGLQPATPLAELNTPFNEGSPSVSPFGDFLYFASDRPGGEGGFDLYRSRRLRGVFQLPTGLGVTVNTSANELDPGLSLGGYRLDFSSDRRTADADPGAAREYNIYQTTSREVFAETETLARASIDWLALWRAIGPNLLWALLALLLLLLMVWLVGGVRHRRLSLIMKCLLASLAAHLLLMLLFNTMEVASTIAGELGKGRRGPIQIALVPGSGGHSITAQIRGGIGEFASLSPPPTTPSTLQPAPLFSDAPTTKTIEVAAPPTSTVRADLPAAQVLTRDSTVLPSLALTAVRTFEPPPRPTVLELPPLETADRIRQGDSPESLPTAALSAVRAASPIADAPVSARAELSAPGSSPIVAAPPAAEFRSSEATLARRSALAGVSPSTSLGTHSGFAVSDLAPLESAQPVQTGETASIAPRPGAGTDVRAQLAVGATTGKSLGAEKGLALPAGSPRGTGGSLVGGVSAIDTSAPSGGGLSASAPASGSLVAGIGPRTTARPAAPTEQAQPFSGAETGGGIAGTSPAAPPSARAVLASGYVPGSSGTSVRLGLPSTGAGSGTVGGSLAGPSRITDASGAGGRAAVGSANGVFAAMVPSNKRGSSVGLPATDAPIAAGGTPPTDPAPIPAASSSVNPRLPAFAASSIASSSHPGVLPLSKTVIGSSPVPMPTALQPRTSVGSPSAMVSRLGQTPNFDAKPGATAVELSLPSDVGSPLPVEMGRPKETPDDVAIVPTNVLGTIRGKVIDAETGEPIRRAKVRLDLPGKLSVVASTKPDGSYRLKVPDVPEFFALSASVDGFVPKSVNIERASMEGTTVIQDFALEHASAAILATEAIPDVHHLGDNRFDGTINSQFQKQSEGAEFSIQFELSEAQLPPHFNRAQVRLMAKGVQRNHRIVINDNTLSRRLNQAPEDGSFGEFRAPFDPTVLRAGRNTLQIIAAPSPDDIDDFEFVNVQVRLAP